MSDRVLSGRRQLEPSSAYKQRGKCSLHQCRLADSLPGQIKMSRAWSHAAKSANTIDPVRLVELTHRSQHLLERFLPPSVSSRRGQALTISASISSLRCISARAYSRGSPGYASGWGRGSDVDGGSAGAGKAMAR